MLDTDGVNALAAPGGLVHITRGALSLIKSEAELAGVLGHEIIHVTEKHTIKAIQKGKMVQIGADETVGSAGVFNKLVDKATGVVMAGFGREEELEADRKGIVIANTVGYNPNGLKDFLTTLAERNKASTEKQGLFASHPEMKERFDKLDDTVKTSKLTATATVEERYKKHVTYAPVAITAIATVETGLGGPCRWRLRQGGRHGQGGRQGRRQDRGAEEEARVRARPPRSRRPVAAKNRPARPPVRRPRAASTPSATPKAAATRTWCR